VGADRLRIAAGDPEVVLFGERQARDVVKPPHAIGIGKAGARKLVTVERRIGEQVSDLPTVKRVVMAMLLTPRARFDFRIVDHSESFPSWLAQRRAGLADCPWPLVAG
jgi:hypothetical protein